MLAFVRGSVDPNTGLSKLGNYIYRGRQAFAQQRLLWGSKACKAYADVQPRSAHTTTITGTVFRPQDLVRNKTVLDIV